MPTLDDSLSLILPCLPPALVPESGRPGVRRLARWLAPIHCAGFECRLSAGVDRVDLQQRILALDDEPRRLAAHVERSDLARDHRWRAVARLCASWADTGDPLHEALAGAWLEFDLAGAATDSDAMNAGRRSAGPRNAGPTGAGVDERSGWPPVPSVFVQLAAGGPESSQAGSLGTAVRAIERLTSGPPADAVVATLERCVETAPSPAALTYVGVMLGRRADVMRAVIGPLRGGELQAWLRDVGWTGPGERLERALGFLPGAGGGLSVSLDVGAGVQQRLGVEFFPGQQPAEGPLWEELLDALVGAGLCTPAKRRGLLRWPGHVYPTDADGPWPANLIAASLLRSAAAFGVLGRRLNHVKLDVHPEGPLAAKAYFGFGPLWLRADGPGAARAAGSGDAPDGPAGPSEGSRGAPGRSAGASHRSPGSDRSRGPSDVSPRPSETAVASVDPRELDAAIERGLDYLRAARHADGWWRDFPNVQDGSDEWVTAYVGAALASVPSRRAHGLLRSAWKMLSECRRDSGGWGYHAGIPGDADSTAWGLRLAGAAGQAEVARARGARRFLDRHLDAGGGASTYVAASRPRLAESLGDVDTSGFCDVHACVTAAVATLQAGSGRCRRWLLDRQLDDGRWGGYWWCDDEYTTTLAVEALLEEPGERARRSVLRAAAWARRRVGASGAVRSARFDDESPFATALCARVLVMTAEVGEGGEGVDGVLERAVGWLIDAQEGDGSWRPSALLRIPPPHQSDPLACPEGTFVATDTGVFTVATVLWTLGLARRWLTAAVRPARDPRRSGPRTGSDAWTSP